MLGRGGQRASHAQGGNHAGQAGAVQRVGARRHRRVCGCARASGRRGEWWVWCRGMWCAGLAHWLPACLAVGVRRSGCGQVPRCASGRPSGTRAGHPPSHQRLACLPAPPIRRMRPRREDVESQHQPAAAGGGTRGARAARLLHAAPLHAGHWVVGQDPQVLGPAHRQPSAHTAAARAGVRHGCGG